MINAIDLRSRIVKWLREYLSNSKKLGYVVNLSGGVDSSTLALLANEAIANEVRGRLVVLTLPAGKDEADYIDARSARELIKDFDLDQREFNLAAVIEQMQQILDLGDPASCVNLKARLRTAVAYDIARKENLLVLGTINAVEYHIGYFPKNSSAGDLLPLVYVLKREIREIARSFGMPEHIVQAKASGCQGSATAEKDWGFSEEAADIMTTFLLAEGVAKLNTLSDDLDPAAVRRFIELNTTTEHKRRLYPAFTRLPREFRL